MSDPVSIETDMAPGFWWIGPEDNPVLVENAEAVMPHLPYYWRAGQLNGLDPWQSGHPISG